MMELEREIEKVLKGHFCIPNRLAFESLVSDLARLVKRGPSHDYNCMQNDPDQPEVCTCSIGNRKEPSRKELENILSKMRPTVSGFNWVPLTDAIMSWSRGGVQRQEPSDPHRTCGRLDHKMGCECDKQRQEPSRKELDKVLVEIGWSVKNNPMNDSEWEKLSAWSRGESTAPKWCEHWKSNTNNRWWSGAASRWALSDDKFCQFCGAPRPKDS